MYVHSLVVLVLFEFEMCIQKKKKSQKKNSSRESPFKREILALGDPSPQQGSTWFEGSQDLTKSQLILKILVLAHHAPICFPADT